MARGGLGSRDVPVVQGRQRGAWSARGCRCRGRPEGGVKQFQYKLQLMSGTATRSSSSGLPETTRTIMVIKQSFNTRELADYLGVGRETARLIARREPGVTRVDGRGAGKRHHHRI